MLDNSQSHGPFRRGASELLRTVAGVLESRNCPRFFDACSSARAILLQVAPFHRGAAPSTVNRIVDVFRWWHPSMSGQQSKSRSKRAPIILVPVRLVLLVTGTKSKSENPLALSCHLSCVSRACKRRPPGCDRIAFLRKCPPCVVSTTNLCGCVLDTPACLRREEPTTPYPPISHAHQSTSHERAI